MTASSPIPCIDCGYDLRGIDPVGKCPECGSPVEDSARPDRLVHADRAWLARVARGWRLLAWGAASPFIALAVLAIVSLSSKGTMAGPQALALPLYNATLLAGAATFLLAVWFATAPERPEPSPATDHSRRRTARIGLLAIGAAILAMSALEALLAPRAAWVSTPAAVVGPVLFGAAAIPLHALWRHAYDLARRVPDPRVARSARRTAVDSRIILLAVAAAMLADNLAPLIIGSPAGGGGGVAQTILDVIGIVAAVLYLGMIVLLVETILTAASLRRALARLLR